MALSKQTTTRDGETLQAYWKVVGFYADVAALAGRIVLYPYRSREAAASGLSPVQATPVEIMLNGADFMALALSPLSGMANITTLYDAIATAAYGKAKQLPEFQGAEDV